MHKIERELLFAIGRTLSDLVKTSRWPGTSNVNALDRALAKFAEFHAVND